MYMKPIPLDELVTYARCPMEWFWEHRVSLPRPQTPRALVPHLLQQASHHYYITQSADSMVEGFKLACADWFDDWKDKPLGRAVLRYAEVQTAIIEQFETGKITKPGGQPYTAPRMTNAYKERMHTQGLIDLGAKLDEFARRRRLALPADYGAGSAFGDAFADALKIARRADTPIDGWPAREVVIGCHHPFTVKLGEQLTIEGVADLVLQPPEGEDTAAAAQLEIHDYRPQEAWLGSASRHLKVIAASLSESTASADGEGPTWQKVSRVTYRHLLSGRTFTRSEISPGRLMSVVMSAVRGIRSQVIVPRMLTRPEDCRECAYFDKCFGDDWEAVDLVDPTALAESEQLLSAVRSARQALNGDGRAAHLAAAALETLVSEMAKQAPDRTAMEALLNEAGHSIRDATTQESRL